MLEQIFGVAADTTMDVVTFVFYCICCKLITKGMLPIRLNYT